MMKIKVFSWFVRNPWAIVLLACLVAGIVFKDGVVKVVALLHPLKHETTAKATVKHSNRVLHRETFYPDGRTKTVETLTDLGVTTTKAETASIQTQQEVPKLFAMGIQAGYGVVNGTWDGGVYVSYEPLRIGVSNPVAIQFQPRVWADLTLIRR